LADQFPANQRSSNLCSRNGPAVQEVCQVWRSVREAFRKVTDCSREVGSGAGLGVGCRWVEEMVGGWVSSRSGLFCLLK